MEDNEFLLLIQEVITKKPYLFQPTLMALTQGLQDSFKKQQELANDMEVLALSAIAMLGEKRVSLKSKKALERTMMSKLVPHIENDDTKYAWSWALANNGKE